MAARKRPMLNTVAGATELARSVLTKIVPPEDVQMTEVERRIFDKLIMARETATWTDYELHVVASLAQVERRFMELSANVDRDGYTIINDRGTRVGNPEMAMMKDCRMTASMLSRQLGLSAPQRGLGTAEQHKRNDASAKANAAINKASEDDLI